MEGGGDVGEESGREILGACRVLLSELFLFFTHMRNETLFAGLYNADRISDRNVRPRYRPKGR
jgi:hypothetical protein